MLYKKYFTLGQYDRHRSVYEELITNLFASLIYIYYSIFNTSEDEVLSYK
jgi:hypothetical protein